MLRHFRRFSSSSSFSSLPETADAVVIGGGVIGASTAYHLAKRGIKPLILERHKLTSGTTWHSAAMLNTPRLSSSDHSIVMCTKELVTGQLEEETGVSPGFVQRGGLTVTKDPKHYQDLQRMKTYGDYNGQDFRLVTPDEIKEIHPLLETKDLVGGLYAPTDGSLDPTGLTNAYAKGARDGGGILLEGYPVEDLVIENGKLVGVKTKHGVVRTSVAVLCAGAWSRALAARAGVPAPMLANKHSYVVTDIVPQLAELQKGGKRMIPNLRLLDHSVYYKVQNDTVQLGGFEPNPEFVDVDPGLVFGLYDLDWDVFGPLVQDMQDNMPCLKNVGNRSVICGPESFTPDNRPLFGEAPEVSGLYFNCGECSRGAQCSGGLGREMATLVDTGSTDVDMFGSDVARFADACVANENWIKEGTQESEVRTYWTGFPHAHRFGGRNVLLSPFHRFNLERGAYFGQYGMYEMPRFFLPEMGDALAVPEYDWYGHYGHEKKTSPYQELWGECVDWTYSDKVNRALKEEMTACRTDAAIFDLSALGKLIVSGSDALSHLQRICSADVDIPVNTSVYSLMMNEKSGIEAEFVVSRESADVFYLMVGSAVPKFVTRRIRSYAPEGADVRVDDVTDAIGIVSVQGPNSAKILSKVLGDELSVSLPSYGQCKKFELEASQPTSLVARRLTYVGERGYELHVPRERCEQIIRSVLEAGPDVRSAGMEAMMDLHMEAGFRHWHGDVDCSDNPFETGLMDACKMESPIDFVGKAALAARSIQGPPKQRMTTFTVDASHPVHGSETIYRNGKIVGYVVRAGFTHDLGRRMGTGYVKAAAGGGTVASEEFIRSGKYEIEVFGKRVPAEVHFDPVHSSDFRN